jgi:hypothetical protein
MSIVNADGSQQFIGFALPTDSLPEFEAQIDRLLDQLNAARKQARIAFGS